MTPKTILCFGDSNTHGTLPMTSLTDVRRLPLEHRWTSIMAAALGAAWQVIAEGHPGRTSVHDDPIEGAHKNAMRTLPALLESHRPIDLVILMLGTNDLKSRFQVSAAEIALSVEKLVGTIKASPCGQDQHPPQLLVVTPPPLRDAGVLMEFFEGGVEKSSRFTKAFAAMGKRASVLVWDAGTACSMSLIDGIHLDEEGHKALGSALAVEVERLDL
ncbi:MAG: SGNH/GDSL hydrolase family protein [Hyphomicrobiales bacterium]